MSEIFVSYSRRDTETVEKIVQQLGQAGMSVWIDREDIRAGDSWRLQIVEAIDTCHAFVLMLSGDSAISVNVQKEISLAADSGRSIFVMQLGPVTLPAMIRYQLAGLQFIDLQLLGFDKAAAQLIASLNEHLKKFRPAGERSQRQTELVIQGIDVSAFTAEKQAELLAFISNLANVDQSQLRVATIMSGSVHVFVDMPSRAAYQLKTLALNRDRRFGQIGITSLKLDGDLKYVNIALGQLTTTATLSLARLFWMKVPPLFSSIFGITTGKLLTVFSALFVFASLGVFASALTLYLILPPSVPTPTPTFTPVPTSTLTSTPIPSLTFTAIPTLTFTQTLTPTAEDTSTPTVTASPTSSPTLAYRSLDGVIVETEDRIACRYGPGDPYLYMFEPISGNRIRVDGKAEIQQDDTSELWLFGLLQGYESRCWVNAKYVKLDGDVASLESYYPDERAPLISFEHPRFPPPADVSASRDGDRVYIAWVGYTLAPGDRESENSPVYLIEAWTCQGGRIVFSPIGAYQEFESVRDESGCSEPSHGRVYVAHKDGYIGPVEIPWP
jgi:hypothetical protein